MADDRPDVTEDTNLQLKAVSDLASRGQIEAEKALEMERNIKLNDSQRRATKKYPQRYVPSNLPSGVKLTPQGDIGQHRGVEAKIAAPFKGTKIMSTAKYFKGGK
jgi:hypothetical protein